MAADPSLVHVCRRSAVLIAAFAACLTMLVGCADDADVARGPDALLVQPTPSVAAVLTTTSTSTPATVAVPPTSASPRIVTTSSVPPAVGTSPSVRSYRYSVRSRGVVKTDVDSFAAHAAATLTAANGWSLGGKIEFRRVSSGGDFTIWIAEAAKVPQFSSSCSTEYSCRVGRDVIINDDRWQKGTVLSINLDDYRHLVVNHEVGHWLGLGHGSCGGAGRPASVMQQQSKGGAFLGPCSPNAWPVADELRAVAAARDIVLK